MSILVPIAMFGWIPAVLALFAFLPARRAVIAAYLLAWLFLPMAGYKLPGITAYTKMTATSLGVLLGVLIFDSGRLWAFRPSWIDLPLVLWCVAKFGASISNGLGAYDGLSSVQYHLINWGLPYFFGRVYFRDAVSIRELAIGVALGGLVYVPLCLYEIKMSPQLHTMVYGFHQHDFGQSKRFGGWRPTVFMQHGLMVGMWMCMAGLVAWWLWLNGTTRRLAGMTAGWAALVLLGTAVACKSFGAVALLALGMAALWVARQWRSMVPLWCVLAIAPLYMTVRLTGMWSGEGLVDWSAKVGNEERADSLKTRLNSENQFIKAGWNRPLLGFRGWYNTRDYWDEDAGAIPDALWMIEFTGCGLLGLSGLTLFLLLPPAVMWLRLSSQDLRGPLTSPTAVLAMIAVLYAIDNLYNGMLNPIFTGIVGAVAASGVKPVHTGSFMRTREEILCRSPVRTAAGARGVVVSVNQRVFNRSQ